MALVQKHLYEEAMAEFNKARALPGSPAFAMANIAATSALSGNPAEARRWLAQLKQSAQQHYVPAIYLAAIYSSLGEKDEAIAWVQKAFDERSDYMLYLKTEPWFDNLRSDARAQQLLGRVASGGRPSPLE